MKQMLKIFLLCIFCVALGFESLFAQYSAPKNLRAKPTEGNRILLEWDKPDYFDVANYKVYRSTNDTIGFVFIASIPGNIQYYYDYGLQKDVKYNYYISAVKGYEGTGRSNVVSTQALISQGYVVSFYSTPRIQAQVGQAYFYEVAAGSDDPNAKIVYSLLSGPSNLVLNDSLGPGKWRLMWMPIESGRYDISILAENVNDLSPYKAKAIQKFTVQVATKIGNITGQVVDEAGRAVTNAILRFYEINNNNFSYESSTNEFGKYYLNKISAGKYYVYIKAPESHESRWFPSSPETKSDQLTQIIEGGTITKDFELKTKTISMATISGVVKDSMGYPINQANIIVIDAKEYLNLGKDDKSLDIFIDDFKNGYTFKTQSTDVTGQYKIEVPRDNQYFVFCQSNAYKTVYFNNALNVLNATKIYLDGNKEGINFKLSPITITSNLIEGRVIKSDIGIGVESRIIMTKQAPRGPSGGGRVPFRFAECLTVKTDSKGHFIIENVDPSEYIIQAVPYGSYLPTFYSATLRNGTIKWREADSISMTGSVTGLELKTLPSITDGIGSISGTVICRNLPEGQNLSGALVYVLQNDIPIGYGITDINGNYLIKGLRTGIYSILVDKVGYLRPALLTTSVLYPVINVENQNINLDVDPSYVLDVPKFDEKSPVMPGQYYLSQNYPNPFNPSTKIEYGLASAGNVEIKVYDVLGREIALIAREQKPAGNYSVEFNGQNLSSGVYFITFKVEQNNKSVYFDKRKMLLMK